MNTEKNQIQFDKKDIPSITTINIKYDKEKQMHVEATPTEDTVLIPKEISVSDEKKTGTVWGSVFNMANTVIGAGVLAFPYTFYCAGLVLGIILTLVIVVLSGICMHIVVLCAKLDKSGKCRSYQDVIRIYLGKALLIFCEVLFVANLVGALVGFLMIASDSVTPVVQYFFGDELFFCQRRFIVAVLSCVIVFPLILLRSVKTLSFSSLVALGGVMYLTVFIVVVSIIAWVKPGFEFPIAAYPSEKLFVNRGMFGFIPRVIQSVPIVALSFQGLETLCIPTWFELKNATLKKMDFILGASLVISSAVYIIVGVMGFLMFGDDVESNVLINFAADNIPANIARLLLGLTVILSYPLIFFALRLAVHSFLDGGKSIHIGTIEFSVVSVIVFAISVVLAMVLTDIGDVFGIVGSIGSITFVFIYPCLLLWKLVSRSKMKLVWKIISYILIVISILLSIILMILGATVSVMSLFGVGKNK